MGRVRLSDIAGRVGVSSVTVHNALTGQKGVSETLRRKIRETAEEMGYRSPSVLGVGKGRYVRNVGVLISERYLSGRKASSSFYWKMYQDMALAAMGRNCVAVAEILPFEAEERLVLPRLVEERSVDGIVLMGEVDRRYIRFLRETADAPVVFLDFYDKEIAEDAVVADSFYGMYLMTEYLFERGFRKMAYLGSIHATSSIMDRYCGFRKALLEHGEDLPEEWLIEDRNEKGQMDFQLPCHLPEAFVCNCDMAAGMLMDKLEKRGLRVPEDISVVGFDNYLTSPYANRKITSYAVDTGLLAKTALDKVLRQMRSPGASRGLNVVSGCIIEKESVGFPPQREKETGQFSLK